MTKFMGDTYIGKPLPKTMDWTRTALILVTGDAPNTIGNGQAV